ncbi:MAG: exosortase/archaeosortase family protein [Verrucomicrobiae bacterium]|nr:exosortase/archaeosortase family protein [Verrucomicrobiae bacterium]
MSIMAQHATEEPKTNRATVSRPLAIGMVLMVGVLLGLVYAPLLVWLGATSFKVEQLQTGGVLVLFAIVICMRDTISSLRIEPNLNTQGLALFFLGMAFLSFAGKYQHWVLPMYLLSFCLSFAAIISFLFGKLGVRQFLPALGGFLVFGILAGSFPALDWPLREVAAKHSGAFLSWLGVQVQVAYVPARPPELLLATHGQIFVVATECNGFGLLTSSLLLATILGFQYRLAAIRKLGLFAFAIPAAIIFNFLRIAAICMIAPRFPKTSYDFIHETVGTILYLAGLAIVWYAAGEFVDKAKAESGKRQVLRS